MTLRVFEVPRDGEIWERSGVEPARVDGQEPWIRRLIISGDDDRRLTFTYDPQARSIVVVVEEGGHMLFRIEREHAVKLLVTDERPPRIHVEFRSDDTSGALDVSWSPRIAITESSLVC